MKILETERLVLRQLTIDDSAFILELVNTPKWLEFIGDKNVKSLEDAKNYILNGPIESYRENGYGLWLVELKELHTRIGLCGLLNREILENIDIGFALLPKYFGNGYGFEMAQATVEYANSNLKMEKLLAIANPNNAISISLLNKLGFNFTKRITMPEGHSVHLFSQ